jgi:mono/diheme cytochrome c family protein
MTPLKKRLAWASAVLVIGLGLVGTVCFLNVRDEVDVSVVFASAAPSQSLIERGAYLARAGNCASCHTARGGAAFAGGLGIPTPFGTVFTSNLTPDVHTGLGNWSPAHFWRAMHNGRAKDGRLLYPAFPYTSYTEVTREDSDALYAYLQSLPAVEQANRPHEVRFPYNLQAALAVWRALYFRPGVYKPDASRPAEWNRGAYLVQGLGHCAACHAPRNALGATSDGLDLAGGLIPLQNWYAPSLSSPHEAGVADWNRDEIIALLRNGVSPRASVTGPMADVVLRGTQYLSTEDLGAMATFLKDLPVTHAADAAKETKEAGAAAPRTAANANDERGLKLYAQHCAQCHGDDGKGVPNAYPALAGNRAVTMPSTANLVQIVLNGGYAPATRGNPRPYGMPPFVLLLNDADMALLLTHVRQSWGNQGASVTPLEVNRIRAGSAPGS